MDKLIKSIDLDLNLSHLDSAETDSPLSPSPSPEKKKKQLKKIYIFGISNLLSSANRLHIERQEEKKNNAIEKLKISFP